MNTIPDRPFLSRLSVRFSVMLALALLPIGLFAFVQTATLENEVKARSEAGLLGATLRAAESETAVIRRAQGLMAGLAQAVPTVANDDAACSALAKRVAAQEPSAALVAFFPVSGMMRCSSTGQQFDFSKHPLFPEVRDARAPHFVVNRSGPISNVSVLGISHPVFTADGTYLGFVSMSLPHKALMALKTSGASIEDVNSQLLFFWTFDATGALLTSSVDLAEAARRIPANMPLRKLVGTTGDVFEGVSASGMPRTYAVVPIVAGQLYLMSSWQSPPGSVLSQSRLGPYAPIVMMWLAGLIVAAIAAQLLVTRHVRLLNTAMTKFAKGDRSLQALELRAAPVELRELGDAYLSMTDSIMHGEAQLEDLVHQKEVLLREVHHRVKNNLQLIASIMNIQIRKASSAEAKALLKGLQDRVLSLATIHRGLYQTSGMADVQAAELFSDIVRQIVALSALGERQIEMKVDVDDIRLVPDQAVPLSLLLTEALTNAIKHSGGSRPLAGSVTIRLKRIGGSDAMLEVINSVQPMAAPSEGALDQMNTGLGTQLITAFVQQLNGRLESGRDGDSYRLRVIFNVRPLAAAESRSDEGTLTAADGNA